MMYSISCLWLILLVSATAFATDSTFEDCPTKYSALEEALYATGDNMFELNRVFYPPSMPPTRFIKVRYTFLNEAGDDDGCTVTYLWAIGIILFFQPPILFAHNSLYFNYPNNNLTSVDLQLPYECRPLINVNMSSSSNEMCSCISDSQKLDILTQQVSNGSEYYKSGG